MNCKKGNIKFKISDLNPNFRLSFFGRIFT